jgi:hypothetical protein
LRTAFVALAVLGACQDPTVSVRVTVPSAPSTYENLTISVTVLAPAAGQPIDCDTLAFGEVTPEAIQLAEVTGVTFVQSDPGDVPIDGVPRLGTKLWLAQGHDDDGVLEVAGCATEGDIDSDDTVTIDTEPAATIQLEPLAADAPVPDMLGVAVRDAFDAPLEGRAVHWDVYGPASADLDGDQELATAADGTVKLPLDAPPRPGPVSIQVRARWAAAQPAVAAAFEPPDGMGFNVDRTCTVAVDTLTVDNSAWHPIHAGGDAGLAGLARNEMRAYLYAASWDGAVATDDCTPDLGPTVAFTVLRAGTGHPADRLITMTASTWNETAVTKPAGSVQLVPGASLPWTNPGAFPPVALATVPTCGTDDGADDVVLAQLVNDQVLAFDAEGASTASMLANGLTLAIPQLVTTFQAPLRLGAAGCIQLEPGGAVPGVVLETVRDQSTEAAAQHRFLAVIGPDGFAIVPVMSYGAVSFSDVTDATPTLIGGTVEPDGAKVVRWQLAQVNDMLALQDVQRVDSLGPPASAAYGDVDGDGQPDLVWGLVDAVQGGFQEARVEAWMGCGAGDLPLDGVSAPIATAGAAVFLAPGLAPDAGGADVMVGSSRTVVFADTAP